MYMQLTDSLFINALRIEWMLNKLAGISYIIIVVFFRGVFLTLGSHTMDYATLSGRLFGGFLAAYLVLRIYYPESAKWLLKMCIPAALFLLIWPIASVNPNLVSFYIAGVVGVASFLSKNRTKIDCQKSNN